MIDNALVKTYSGEWQDGFRHGRGMLFGQEPGEQYDGEWLRGKRHGEGKQTQPDGTVYEGSWAEHKRHGWGRETHVNGDVFEGHWLDDKKEGSGTFYYMSRKKRTDGEWVDNCCKCGLMSDFGLDPNGGKPDNFGSDPSKRLPQLGLKDARTVLNGCLAAIRQERGAVRLQKTPIEEIFAGDDLEQVILCFNSLPACGMDCISAQSVRDAFPELGIDISEEQLTHALEALAVDENQGVSLDDFCLSLIHI
eukprot:TRINITY_DN21842_c0_g1_i1.p1 TRINITY_DN21842_c0_g1~~TRINITY_DN21842_c0_g1_i1.p1  ORF type:complete len:250 (-),score=77.08 TRINITY_DN21842_c0_g1_i1:189-938(-)